MNKKNYKSINLLKKAIKWINDMTIKHSNDKELVEGGNKVTDILERQLKNISNNDTQRNG